MSIKRVKSRSPEREDFARRTITIPAELVDFVDEATSQPEHAGNFSSYVRALIIRDRNARPRDKKAA